jgi:CDP-glucose 4,6-dehydratase
VGFGQGAVEGMAVRPEFWAGRRVFLTGHTGFKGAWTAMLLRSLGSRVFGYALPPTESNGLFVAGSVGSDIDHRQGDIRDPSSLTSAIENASPSIVIHMAAQSLVRRSYIQPVETYETNIMGTIHLLEVVRNLSGIEAVIVVTSDKVYENTEASRLYREGDRLGGHDPYSNSKACTELVTDAYRRSFFNRDGGPGVATGRAGNVIGGGDWAQNRLVPDAIRAFTAGQPLSIRNPHAVRPWQHVLDAIVGYLQLAERLVEGGGQFADAWNFGPGKESEVSVQVIVEKVISLWGDGARWELDEGNHPHESAYLRLDCSKAADGLDWHPRLDLDEALAMTIDWYRALRDGCEMRTVTQRQIARMLDGR